MNGDGPARLTSALLVKKGNATPATYGLGMQPISALVEDAQKTRKMFSFFRRAGAEAPEASETPVEVTQAPAKTPRLPRPSQPRSPRKPARRDTRSRLTLRVDADTNLRLKLVAAHRRDSLQAVITRAVHFYLDEVGPSVCEKKCACLESGRLRELPPGGCALI